MKQIKFLCTAIVVLLMVSCGSTRKASRSIEKQVGTEVEASIPFKSSNISDTKNEYRGVSNGISADWNMAKSIAFTNARSELATKLETVVRTAVESYTKQYAASTTDNDVQRDLGQSIQAYTLVTAKQTLVNVNELEVNFTRNVRTLDYTCWVAIEISKSQVIDEMIQQFEKLPRSTKQSINYDRDQFRGYLEEYLK